MSIWWKTLLLISLLANLFLLVVAWKARVWRGELHQRSQDLQQQSRRLASARAEGLRRCSESLARLDARPDVVLIGASITHELDPARYFPERRYHVSAISGETSDQILARFSRDALAAKPRLIFIAGDGGINRLIHRGATRQQVDELLADVEAMVVDARDAGIEVVLGSVLPTHERGTPEVAAAGRLVKEANRGLEALAKGRGVRYADLATGLRGEDGRLRPELSEDGLHLNERGRLELARAMDEVLVEALARSTSGSRPTPAQASGQAP